MRRAISVSSPGPWSRWWWRLCHLPEVIVNRLLGWPSSLWSPLGYIFRDLLFAVIWIDGWLGDDFVWLGNSMTVREASEETVDGSAWGGW